MKKLLSIILTISVLCSFNCYAWYVDPNVLSLEITSSDYSNAEYIEILVQKSKIEYYTDFRAENIGNTGITRDSEIVNYEEDDYCSYTFHSPLAEEIPNRRIVDGYIYYDFQMVKQTIYEFAIQFEEIKVAYIDKDGNVLAVTNSTTIVNRSIKRDIPQIDIDIVVDGLALSVSFETGPPIYLHFIFVAIAIIFVAIAAIILLVRFVFSKKSL